MAGRVVAAGRDDAARLASGELVYQGVVRTPLCALGPRIEFRGAHYNVMNELFATSADVYRLTGELDPAHDQHPAADGAPKDRAATQRRLARMIGLDARDASDEQWLRFARTWRERQLTELRDNAARVVAAHDLPAHAPVGRRRLRRLSCARARGVDAAPVPFHRLADAVGWRRSARLGARRGALRRRGAAREGARACGW